MNLKPFLTIELSAKCRKCFVVVLKKKVVDIPEPGKKKKYSEKKRCPLCKTWTSISAFAYGPDKKRN